MQLRALFERVSGSMELKGQDEDKKRFKRQAVEKHAEEAEQRSALAKRKGAFKKQKEEAEKQKQCLKEQARLPPSSPSKFTFLPPDMRRSASAPRRC
jgi:hypothetical protein